MNLHRAFDSEDAQAAERALADPFIRHMDVEYAKLTRSVPLPKGLSDLENAARPKMNLEDLVDDIPAIDDDVRILLLYVSVIIMQVTMVTSYLRFCFELRISRMNTEVVAVVATTS